MAGTEERDAYGTAEREAARFLFDALGVVPGREGFVGHQTGSVVGVSFQFDEAPREYGAQFQTGRRLARVALYGSLRIVSPSRGEVSRLLSSALAAFPYAPEPGAALEQLRVRDDGLGAIAPTTVYRPAADGGMEGSPAWSVDLGVDAVFRLRS